MFLGHYGLALAAKRAAPRTSLGSTVFAAQWLDELWPILLLVGIERVRIAPGLMAANPLDFVHYPFSHSLAAAIVWGVLVALLHHAWRRDLRGATLVGLLVVSHWLLDLPMHRPDLPLWPGDAPLVGLGLWNSLAATLAVELALFGAGLATYVRATRPRDAIGRWGLWALVATLVVIYLGGAVGAPPHDASSLARMTLGLWLFVPWCTWVDRHREPMEDAVASRTLVTPPPPAAAA